MIDDGLPMGQTIFQVGDGQTREFITWLQEQIDRFSKPERRKLMRKLQNREHQLRFEETLALVALKKNVSIARAFEILTEMLADGRMIAKAHMGSPDGPIEEIPAEMFRGPRA